MDVMSTSMNDAQFSIKINLIKDKYNELKQLKETLSHIFHKNTLSFLLCLHTFLVSVRL